MAEYRGSYNIPFDVDESILADLKNELEAHGVPSISKIGVGITFARSLPYVNGNGLCISAKCIKNSLDSGRYSQFDFLHNQSDIMGVMIGLKTYDDTDELIPEKPLRVFGLGALYRKRLKDAYIDPKDLPNWGTSLEVLFADFDFWHKGKVVLKEDAEPDWLLHVDDIIEGIPYYADNSRVCIIAGGVDEDARVDFNGNALTMNPADKESGVLLAVAQHRYPVFDLGITVKEEEKGGKTMPFKAFETEADYNAAVAQIKNDYKTELKYDELTNELTETKGKLQTAEASLATKETELTETGEKLKTAEASLQTERERADQAEDKLNKQAIATLIQERKQVLASKKYPEDRIAKKEEWLGTASKEDFDSFVEEIDVLFATATKTMEAKAEQAGLKEVFASINLTGKQEGNDDQGSQIDKSKINVIM